MLINQITNGSPFVQNLQLEEEKQRISCKFGFQFRDQKKEKLNFHATEFKTSICIFSFTLLKNMEMLNFKFAIERMD